MWDHQAEWMHTRSRSTSPRPSTVTTKGAAFRGHRRGLKALDKAVSKLLESGTELRVHPTGNLVLLTATTDVRAGAGKHRQSILTLRRGEVFGEMALVRHSERSADVVAADNVEVHAVDQHFLQRIQRRNPRIASKVFLNLTRIVSDRLQRMTDQYVGGGGNT
jgi:hypothetical protein